MQQTMTFSECLFSNRRRGLDATPDHSPRGITPCATGDLRKFAYRDPNGESSEHETSGGLCASAGVDPEFSRNSV